MRWTTRSAFLALFLGFSGPSLAAACSMAESPRPLRCAESVDLSLAVDGEALFPGDRARLEAFLGRLRAKAIRTLGENRIALDPESQELRLEILKTTHGGALIAVSSTRDEAAADGRSEPATETISAEGWREPEILEEAALDLFSRTIAANWGSDCEPSRILSADGRYALELPPSFPEARDRYLTTLAKEVWLDPSNRLPVVSLLALSAEGEEERLWNFRLEEGTTPERFLVSNDGNYVVGFDLRLPKNPGLAEGITRIYRADDGSVVRRLAPSDVLTVGDLEEINRTSWTCGGSVSPLGASLDDDRNRLVLTLDHGGKADRIAIDLATGALLTPRRDLLPHMGVRVGNSFVAGSPERPWNPTVCVDRGDELQANRAFAVPGSPRARLEQAIEQPLPGYTEIAKRARLQGTVEVEVLVSETGRVSCVRTSRLPMGLDKSAEAAALHWRFPPFVQNGEPARAVGRFSFHFGYHLAGEP